MAPHRTSTSGKAAASHASSAPLVKTCLGAMRGHSMAGQPEPDTATTESTTAEEKAAGEPKDTPDWAEVQNPSVQAPDPIGFDGAA